MSEHPDLEAVASELGMTEAESDFLKTQTIETYERGRAILAQVKKLGHTFAVEKDGDVFVNVSWLGTLLLMESEQTMRGNGGCPDYMRVLDLLSTTIVAAQTEVESGLDRA